MNNLNNYLPKDVERAAQLTKKFWSQMKELEEQFTQGNIDKAKYSATQIIHVAKDLEFLRERKTNHDRLRKVAVDMENQGITVAIVRHAK
ncbi:YqaH family protein [Halobacillus sp. SY10]|uniref:YqaH family protein n=1 Tax=Halobacillus sp. SY10 TaxID=3381356 RepID=UPI003879B099